MGASLLYGLGMLLLAIRISAPWVPWFTTAVDVSLVTAALTSVVLSGNPLGALNNRTFFDTYFFVVITSTLRYDWRLSAFAGAARRWPVRRADGATSAAHWDLAQLESPLHGPFARSAHALRIIILAGAGLAAVAVARWARHLRLMVGTDHLTGLSQRRPFLERLEEELSARPRAGRR